MAGNDDADRVVVVGVADGAHGGGAADAPCHLAVAAGLAIGDALQLLPAETLELGAGQVERQVEGAPRPRQVLGELAARLRERRGVRIGRGVRPGAPQPDLGALPVGTVGQPDQTAGANDRDRPAEGVREQVVAEIAGSHLGPPAQNFRIRPTTTPWTRTSRAGTRIGSMVGWAGCRRTIFPSG